MGSQELGEVLLLDDSSGLAGMAICHLGAGTEAGSRGCYVKFGLVKPGHGAEVRFSALLDLCEALAADQGADHVELGVNTGRCEAYAALIARGYRAGLVGVSMHRTMTRLQPARPLAHRRLALGRVLVERTPRRPPSSPMTIRSRSLRQRRPSWTPAADAVGRACRRAATTPTAC